MTTAQVLKQIRRVMRSLTADALTVQDVAAHYKTSVRTIYRRTADGTLPKPDIKCGNFVRWLPETIRNFKTNGSKK